MTLAYACILIAALLPYLWTAIAKALGERYDNRDPRAWQARQQNPRSQRAYAAHLNAFEAFAPFAAGVLMAQSAGVGEARVAALAVAFVALRVLHGLCYLAGWHRTRSLVWLGGLSCVLALMLSATLAFAGARA
ncbi:MAPEG family protein [Vulcaniibacterium tengchongense]|uniref:Putative MAPEG superfamily protein n=1 Tax=Vulcaniibacterium tengchongense TaxID=1273429 RepID=A0A3N4UZ16_9GAMM|nr:MAPEG family protein [Vulcaniibacterium tengchongense]RPE75972.1 putative MAPEG superfamily protein [Vulcaniibacterium tengchongense]